METRMAGFTELVPELGQVTSALYKAAGNGSLPKTPMGLAGLRIGQLAGNTYLAIRTSTDLRRAGETEERIAAVATWRDAPYFTDAERTALALAEAVFTPNPHGERVSDELYAQATKHFDDKALATLMIAFGQIAFWSVVAVIAKPPPAVS